MRGERSFDQVLDDEIRCIRERRGAVWPGGETTDEALSGKLVGLALSGGGIRSATFSLGILQRLAKYNILDKVDYLSTVSGGGYTGGALTFFANAHDELGTGAKNFPYGVHDPREGIRKEKDPPILKHLRLNGKYLTPGERITGVSLAGVVLRGVLLNFLVWMPLVTAALVILILAGSCVRGYIPGSEYICGFVHRCCVDLGYVCTSHGKYGLEWLLWLAALAGTVFVVLSVFYSLGTRILGDSGRYKLRRCFEKAIRWVLIPGGIFLAVGSLPLVSGALIDGSSVLLGLGGGFWTFLRSRSNAKGKIPLGFLAAVASAALLYGLVLVSYELASLVVGPDSISRTCMWWLGLSVSVSVVTGSCVNLNFISIHRYYRDRLIEAFMPDPATVGEDPKQVGKNAPATAADVARLSDMCSKRAPYLLVNTNIVLVDSDIPRRRVRGGDSFLLSPKSCGSDATGWVRTDCYMRKDPLTLATAVAISGASVNPNTGAAGKGPTRKPMMSLLMALLNVRLGYWVRHPGAHRRHGPVASHFGAAFYELSPSGFAEHREMIQISDGGHFENLGVYELIRRKVKLIICCDGAADPDFEFIDLQVLTRRIAVDFGAQIEFDHENRLENLIPREPDPQAVINRDAGLEAYPIGVRFAQQGHIKGTITYEDGGTATLILLKTTMTKGLGLLVRGYKAANRNFPDQSTADQFFDEEQFEAYRELGFEIADRMVNDPKVGLYRLLDQCH